MDAEKCSAYVSAGHLVFFDEGVTDQLKDDVIDSTLYSQLAASGKHSRFNDVEVWGVKYKEVMTLFGWLILQERTLRCAYGESVEALVEKMLGLNISSHSISRLNKLCADLKKPGTQNPGQHLLLEHALDSRASEGATTLNLLVSFVSPANMVTTVLLSSKTLVPDGQSAIAVHLASERSVGSLSVTALSMEFSERQYRRLRARVSAELGTSRNDLVMAICEGRCHE